MKFFVLCKISFLLSCSSRGLEFSSASKTMKVFIQGPWAVITSHMMGTDCKMKPMEALKEQYV